MPNEIFLARTKKNVAQDPSALPVYEDLSNEFDEVDGEKKPLGNGLKIGFGKVKGEYMRSHFLVCCSLVVVACSSQKDDLVKKNVDALYNKAYMEMKSGEYSEAASDFKEIEVLFPYAARASMGQVLSAYCYFLASNYQEALKLLEVFLRYHPSHELVPYAMYLRAMCIYMQVSSVGRDAKAANEAKLAFVELVNKFPDSVYRDDCLKRIIILDDVIAAHEMSVGRFYQKNGNALSAIGRYNFVITRMRHTKHCPEAHYRTVECCHSIGLNTEASEAYNALLQEFPGNYWSEKAKAVIKFPPHSKSDVSLK
ncbi:MAG: outer membrane protein assembly factor BamD [Holosporaceae bacterium]|nr:outer membrane protein assembly factor BamD [Holosporaceae bacterium]